MVPAVSWDGLLLMPTIKAQDVRWAPSFDVSLAVFPVPDHVKFYRQCGFCRASTPLRAVPGSLASFRLFGQEVLN
jgi:hypothetical protein